MAATILIVDVQSRIARASSTLTPAERRVAEVVLARPQLVAFGTVAELADAATAGAATVVRLASKVGYDGFTGLQIAVQADLARQLRPAAERIREAHPGDPADAIRRQVELETRNVAASLQRIEPAVLDDIVQHVADAGRRVHVLSGDASDGVARQFIADLASLRPGVAQIAGNDVQVRRSVGQIDAGDVVVVLDLRRYDRWVVAAAHHAATLSPYLVAVSDSLLSPFAAVASQSLTVEAGGSGPFDSHVGTLAVLNLLVAGVAERLRSDATERLDRAETAWRETGALVDR
jgi:DNA-binding MurR/RpiR family transcriptional regulator